MQNKFSYVINSIVIYGSNIYNTNSSDLDVCLIVNKCDEKLKEKIIDETISFHKKNGLKIDEEIPHSNKLIYTFDEIDEALNKSPFYVNGKAIIKDINKNKQFLSSKEMKQRLIINILTTDHLVVGKNINKYEQKAFKLIMKVIIEYYNLENPTYKDILNCMYKNIYTGAEGELYLGYKKNYPAKEKYLINKIKEYLKND